MAISLVGTPASGSTTGTGPLTISHTLTNGPGKNRCVVFVHASHASAGGSSGQAQATGVTYDGVDMTLIAQVTSSTGTTSVAGIWYILDADLPAAGSAKNVVATFQGANVNYLLGGVYELADVNQTGGASTIDTSGTLAEPNGSVTTTPHIDLTTGDANSLIVDVLSSSGTSASGPYTATGTNHTARVQAVVGTGRYINSGTMTTTTAGAYTPGWNIGATGDPSRQAMAAAAFTQEIAPAAGCGFLLVYCRQ